MDDGWHPGDRTESATAVADGFVASSGSARSAPRAASLQGSLARIIEGEILPRLLLAHRGTRPSRSRVERRRPTPADVEAFCALLPRSGDAAAHALQVHLDAGLPLDVLLLDLIAPAARHLGTLWETDACDFVEVTVGIGRLQAMTREVCARLEGEGSGAPGAARSILLLPCPGETHLFGPMLAGSFFREAGWHVATGGSRSDPDPCDQVREECFDVIGLSLSCEVLLPALTAAVRDLRAASRNRSVRVIVGGPHFVRAPGDAHLVGADACAGDGPKGPAVADALLEIRDRAC